MKNYLGNLIARHMNKAEVLQPRLASRFEPQSSVLKSDVREPETAEVEVAETFAADAVIAPTESPIAAPKIERRVESPPVQPSRLPETVFESSGLPQSIPNHEIQDDTAALPAQPAKFKSAVSIISPESDDEPTLPAELTTPTIVASDQRDKSTASVTTSARPVRSNEASDSETPSVAPTVFPTPSAGTVAAEPRSTKIIDQVAVADDTVERTLREPSPVRQPAKRSLRTVPAQSNQTLTPATPVELQPLAPTTKTETRREASAQGRESAPPSPSVSHLESHRSPDPPKRRQPNFPAEVDGSSRDLLPAAVIPTPEAKSPVVISAVKEILVPSKRPERFPEEAPPPHLTERAPPLQTSVVRSPRIDPMSGRMESPRDIAPAETGPTINVTIGRIEVRAATQSSEARPQKHEREQRVLSLDEYLSQRSAGGR
jgi:hypothetical protein